MDWKEVILPLLLAAIAAAPGIFALFKGSRKEKADAASTITGAARELIEEYRTKIDEIEAKLDEQAVTIKCQEQKIDKQAVLLRREQFEREEQDKRIYILEVERSELKQGIIDLCAQIRGLGHEPVWEPKE